MKARKLFSMFVTSMIATAVALSTGCLPEPTLSFVAGYLLGTSTAPVQSTETCYLNGVQVDCSTVAQ